MNAENRIIKLTEFFMAQIKFSCRIQIQVVALSKIFDGLAAPDHPHLDKLIHKVEVRN